MASTSEVVADGVETPSRESARPRWGWFAAGLLIGGGLTVVLFQGSATEPVTVTAAPSSLADGMESEGPGEVVEGFPDDIMGVTRGEGRSLELVVWPLAGVMYQRAVTVGASIPPTLVDFDRSGRLLATVLPEPQSEQGVLYAGVADSAAIVDLAVTGYAWHDSEPTSLAYTTHEEGEMLLWVTSGNLSDSTMMARAVGVQGGVVAWGDWGFAVQDGEKIVLFTETGEIKDTHPGRVLASYSTGWIAIDDDELGLLSAGGGIRGLDREGLRGDVFAGKFSPDGEFLALLTRDGLLIVTVDQETGLIQSGTPGGMPQVIWSSDSRFVLYPGRRGIVVVDTEDFSVSEVLTTDIFTGVGIRSPDT